MELNLDGLVGPTHNYGGVAPGNLASKDSEGQTSHPRSAALQGLEKMQLLSELGVPQAILPPHDRPELGLARRLGFTGSDTEIIEAMIEQEPLLLAACYSAASMWTANAATVSPSIDSADQRVHFTPANLRAMVHRSIEAPTTARVLRAIFADETHFAHHAPLPSVSQLGDEGAANHSRFAPAHDEPGIQLFVYGETSTDFSKPRPKLFPARQTEEASRALARLHQLSDNQVVFAQQNPEVIDLGVFHNDVIAVGHLHTFLVHERAYVDTEGTLHHLNDAYETLTGQNITLLRVHEEQVSLRDAISSYLFNSQLLKLPSGELALIAPEECRETPAVHAYLEELRCEGHIEVVHYMDLRQSMHGGGGPACLRLRVPLTDAELAAMNPGCRLTPELYPKLQDWIMRHYREDLAPSDLADPQLLIESRRALDELTQILQIGSIYAFQQA